MAPSSALDTAIVIVQIAPVLLLWTLILAPPAWWIRRSLRERRVARTRRA